MKKFKLLLTAIVILISTISCTISTDELAIEVQKSIAEQLEPKGVTITSFTLTHKEGNEYHGVLESKTAWSENTNIVKVIYDGNTFTWEVEGPITPAETIPQHWKDIYR